MAVNKANRVAVRGLDINGNSVLELRWNNNKLELHGGATPKSVRLLVFFDPEQPEGKWLFVLPVLADSFDLDDKNGGRFEMEGRIRSFLPDPENHGWTKLEMDVVASTDPAALLRFRSLRIGPPSIKNLECTAGVLKAAVLATDHNFFLAKPRYADAGLLELHRDEAASKLRWSEITAFISPTTKQEKVHATLVVERRAEFPVEGTQRFPCFGLTCKGEEFAARRGSGSLKIHYMTFRQRLPWDWTFDGAPGTGSWLVSTDFPQSALFSNWNEQVVDPITTAVHLVEAGRPLTTFPELGMQPHDADKPPSWDAWFTFVDRVQDHTLKKEHYRPGSTDQKTGSESKDVVTIVPRRVTPRGDEPRTAATFSAIKNHSGDPLFATFTCLPINLSSEKDYDVDVGQGIAFRLKQINPLFETETPSAQPVRMGAFDLQFLPNALKEGDVRPFPNLDWSPDSNAYEVWWETERDNLFEVVRLRFRGAKVILGVSAIAPGGEDDIPGEEYAEDVHVDPEARREVKLFGQRSRPLVFALNGSTSDPWVARYRLEMTESIQDRETQTIKFNLFQLRLPEQSNAQPPLQALIIDPQPWFVGLINAAPLNALDPDSASEVANWTNRADLGGGWQVQAQVRGFDLVMPPQAIGEAMHRRIEDDDVVPGQAIDFRFTPPARLTLQQMSNLRRFTEPGWNLRRVTESPLGAGLTEADFELLYGIWGTLRAPNLRLSEITARLGAYPGVPSKNLPWIASNEQENLYEKTRKVWLGLLNGLRSRLAVLEPWSPLKEAFLVTQEDGLQFELRNSASLRYPVRAQTELSSSEPLPSYFKPDGLKGGWSWGFESRNVLNALTRDPKSFAGTLTDFYLSSFGGWGQQRAVFDRGLSTIISRVDMGRASTIVLERIGRISVFWNRAKHVIVYERTVAASRQFYQEQHPLVGNPVLRKVDEYIEILEPERAFPESNAPAAMRGFVTGSRFADGEPPRIRVNSRWGQDIGNTGWKIPLWIRGAQPADVYPKPTIFVLGAGASGERVPIALDDPDKLYFYTSTDPALDVDTNSWPAVEGVDFQAVDPVWLTPPKPKTVTTDPVSFNVDDKSIKEGFGAFTLRLQAAPAPVNYVEGRTPKAIRAIPENVTLMRGAVMETVTTPTPGQLEIRELRTHVENSFAVFVGSDPVKDFPKALAAFDKAFTDVKAAYEKAIEVVENGKDVCQSVQRRVASQFNQFANEAKLEILSALQLFEHQCLEIVKSAFPVADLEELKQRLRHDLAELADETGGARGQIRSLSGLPGEALAKLDLLNDDLQKLIVKVEQAFALATAKIAKLDDWTILPNPQPALELARQALKDLVTEISDFLNRSGFDYRIAEIARTWLGTMPDQGRILLDTARRECQLRIQKLLTDLAKTSRDEVVAELQAIADLGFKELVKLIAHFEEQWREIFDPDAEETWPIENALDQLLNQLEQTIKGLDTVDPALVLKRFSGVTSRYIADLNVEALLMETGASEAAGNLANQICEKVLASAADLKKYLELVLNNAQLKNLESLIKDIDPNEFLRRVDNVLTQMLDDISGLLARARVHIPEIPGAKLPRTINDDVLRLFRSFGQAPDLPQLHFQTPRLGYYFLEGLDKVELPRLLPHINLSPVSAAANELADKVLNSVNLSVPVKELLDRLVPADFRNFELSKSLPRIAGLDLSFLFRSIRMPSMANDGVRVTHGIDEATRSAWLESDVDVTYQESVPVFDIAGVRMMLLRAKFKATIRLDVVLGQQPRQRTFGSISGDWLLTAGGYDLVELKDCTLEFDEGGHIRFHITPAKIKLKPPLNFISDLLEPFGGSENGLHVSISPAGVQTTLCLPVPNIQAGSFGVANLLLGFLFGLDVAPEFRIRTALMIGRPIRPFTLTVFILGGAGYFNFSLMYTPRTGELTMGASIAIFASASLAISLGPVSGGIYAYFGISVDYLTSNRGPSNLTVSLKIIFAGEVSVLGIISVGLTLGLEASYDSQKNLTGRGYVSIHIKIGWFIDISVNAAVSYTFGKGTTTSSSTQIQTAADNYVDMF